MAPDVYENKMLRRLSCGLQYLAQAGWVAILAGD
jgi:hypothetical protein